ncbi:MAG: F0F1 ATP synthase subunit A [Clostridiales bacterium]|nr:F0F1 ATP synthase subunit A [Clostridiales bacterium]
MSWWSEFFRSFAEHLKEEFTPGDIGAKINEAILQVKHYVALGDIKLVLTDAVIVTWIAVTIAVVLLGSMSVKAKIKPDTKQTFVEMLVELLLSVAQGFGLTREEAKHIAPMIGTFCIVITGCNVISIFNIAPPAKNIGFPVAMALCAIFYVIYASIRFVGLKGFWTSLVQPIAILLPFKILDMIIKPCSLALRLFGNVFGAFVFMEFVHIVIPVLLPGLLGLWFDLADGVLQAVVFSYLTIYYIGEIVEVGHELKEHPEHFKKEKKNKKKAVEASDASAAV